MIMSFGEGSVLCTVVDDNVWAVRGQKIYKKYHRMA